MSEYQERKLRLGPVLIYCAFSLVYPVWLSVSLWYGEWMLPLSDSGGIYFAILGGLLWVISTALMYWLFTTDVGEKDE